MLIYAVNGPDHTCNKRTDAPDLGAMGSMGRPERAAAACKPQNLLQAPHLPKLTCGRIAGEVARFERAPAEGVPKHYY